MRRLTLWASGISLLCAAVLAAKIHEVAPPNTNVPLWAVGQVPLAQGTAPLDAPFLTTFLPPEGQRNGGAVIIAPGGSNIMLMYGCEGIEIAERYNTWGVAAFVLTYRMAPRYGDDARIADGLRAVQLVRARAAEWKLNPAKIGLAGFSAGSALTRLVVAQAGPGTPDALDPVTRVSSRPDYAVLVYGPGKPTPAEHLANFPPTFLLSAAADKGAANSTAQLFIDLNQAGAIAELHVYQKGRHGFGAAFTSPEFGPWMPALKHFLQNAGFLPGGTP